MLLFFGGWAVLLAVARCLPSENAAVRHLPDAPAVLLVALACEHLVSGDVLTVAPAAGLFFPIALWLCWRGRRWMRTSPRRTVQAAADVVLSAELGLVLTLFTVWLANVLSFTPPQVTVVLEVVEKVQGLTEVHWLYWMAAYTALALGSYALLRWLRRSSSAPNAGCVRHGSARHGFPCASPRTPFNGRSPASTSPSWSC